MTIRILRAKESWLTGAAGQERQPVPGMASLASPRNSINIAEPPAVRHHVDRRVLAKAGDLIDTWDNPQW
jgi:hypothetical protein